MLKKWLKAIIPRALLGRYRNYRIAQLRAPNANRPVKDVFSEIYRRNLWGGAPGTFSSGTGSKSAQAADYANFVNALIKSRGIQKVVDLGCGDYRVGRLLRQHEVSYVGVDIVPDLILRNTREFSNESTTFLCRDIITDDLPEGDLCLVRQVFQHLSNEQITQILKRLATYPLVLVTEHQPAAGLLTAPNLDKPHGPDTRLVEGSGVYLDSGPFNMEVELVIESRVEQPVVSEGECIRSFLIKNAAIPKAR
jgi:SAM-dependent methyltransferase